MLGGGDFLHHRTGTSVTDAAVMAIVIASLADGRDGDADLDGVNDVPWATRSGSVYTCIRIGLPRNFRVRVGVELKPAQFAGPWSNGDVLIEGSITANGNNASGATAGTATAAGTLPATLAGGAGGAAGGNNAGAAAGATTVEYSTSGRFGGAAGGAGAASSGGALASLSTLSATRGLTHGMGAALGMGLFLSNLGVNTTACGAGGSGGGGNAAGAGGGGGASAGILHLSGRTLTVASTGTISANGGNGAAGGTSAGGGSGGAGGRVTLMFGSVTLADALLSVQVWGGKGGAAGASGGFYGNCGLPGEIIYLAAKPGAMGSRHNAVTMTSAELTAAIVSGVLDISGSFVVGADAGRAVGTVNATGGSGFAVFKLDTPDGEASLRFNASQFRMDLTVRGSVVLSTVDLNGAVSAGPTMQPFVAGDRVDWRVWYDPAGGARSMGIRWFVNRCGGLDEVGVASGSSLAAATAGYALSSSTTQGSWGPAPAYISASRAANVVGTVVILGDSICQGRKNSVGWDGVTPGSRLVLVNQVCVSLAKSGGQFADQTTVWQASPMRGHASVVAVIFQLGHNDIGVGGLSAAQVTTAAQDLVNDIAANNPAAKIIICKMTPAYSVFTAAQQAIWDTVQDNYNGTGGTPVTGVHARATAHVATMGDDNKSLRFRAEDNDFSHPNFWGRALNARSMRAAYDTTGLAA